MPIDWGKPIQPREIPVQPAPMQQPVQQPSQYVQQPVQYAPQVPNVATAANMGVTAAKRAIWPWVVAFMSLFFMLFVVIGLVVAFYFLPDSGGDCESPEKPLSEFVLSTNPAVRASQERRTLVVRRFIVKWLLGLTRVRLIRWRGLLDSSRRQPKR